MKFYFSGASGERDRRALDEAGILHYLFAPDAYNSTVRSQISPKAEVILDAFGYQRYSQKLPPLTLDEVREHYQIVRQWHKESSFKHVICDDHIGNPQLTRDRWDILSKEFSDLPLMPVFQWGAPREDLIHYLASSRVVGLGGLLPLMRDEDEGMFAELQALCEEFPNRFHIFGLRWTRALNAIKDTAHSADSSFWLAGRRYRQAIFVHSKNKQLQRAPGAAIHGDISEHELTRRNILAIADYLGQKRESKAGLICGAASVIAAKLKQQEKLIYPDLAQPLEDAFGCKLSAGRWDAKDAYEAQERALLKQPEVSKASLFLQTVARYADPSAEMLTVWHQQSCEILSGLVELQNRSATQTRRTEDSVALQQFSTVLPLAYLANLAADVRPDDTVMDSSAGTGMLIELASRGASKTILNEYDRDRHEILKVAYPHADHYQVDGEFIADLIPEGRDRPTVAIINPPFSRTPDVEKREAGATFRHLRSALQALPNGGRLVLISANWFYPETSAWREHFERIQETATVQLSVGIQGDVYTKHGTHMDVRLTVVDKVPAPDKTRFRGLVPGLQTLEAAHELIGRRLPPRAEIIEGGDRPKHDFPLPEAETLAPPVELIKGKSVFLAERLRYKYKKPPKADNTELVEGIFEDYEPQTLDIPHGMSHYAATGTHLIETAALASVRLPKPTYRPHLPRLLVEHGTLTTAQLEAVVYAGQAHEKFLSGHYVVDEKFDKLTPCNPSHPDAVQFRQGCFIGDGTGVGKGREIAAIFVDNWCQDRKKGLWISQTPGLLNSARRDWEALGGHPDDIVPLSRFKQGMQIPLAEGIIYTTDATLRSRSRQGAKTRFDQLLDWLGDEPTIIFDESHQLGGAAPEKVERGLKAASLQGTVGVRLQNAIPRARVVYTSATGASRPANLAYTNRLGLWQTKEFPFKSRSELIANLNSAGIAGMEILCRDLKQLGLYISRSLSYKGVEYQVLEIELDEDQRSIYDKYAEAFEIIHNNIDKALRETNVISQGETLNKQAKSAAYSAFEGMKQRFFSHMLIGLKTPKMIDAMEQSLANGHAVVAQLVNTDEAVMERRLAQVDEEEYHDLSIDVTPREYVLDYLRRSFPVINQKLYRSPEGTLQSEPLTDEKGQPVVSKEALARRNALIDDLMLLPPVAGALDQIIHHFGHENVAEVTGRRRRILYDKVEDRYFVGKRSKSSNFNEIQSFNDGRKLILIFSGAGDTGESYHADRNYKNQRKRDHYLIAPGWRADRALQGCPGRTHRSGQVVAPELTLVTTNVKGEKRFTSAIARRLDELGALTRGQRQAASQGFFSARDNLDSDYAKSAYVSLIFQIYHGAFDDQGLGLKDFERKTGLSLTNKDGAMDDEIPPFNRFLNRLLALRIDDQNVLFGAFERILDTNIEAAIANGTYEVGVETIRAKSIKVIESKQLYIHPDTKATTHLNEIMLTHEAKYRTVEEALRKRDQEADWGMDWRYLINEKSGRAALEIEAASEYRNAIAVPRCRLLRPNSSPIWERADIAESNWREATFKEWQAAWEDELSSLPSETLEHIFLITGLILPIWKELEPKSLDQSGVNRRVYRLKTDDGKKLLGRMLKPTELNQLPYFASMRTQVSAAEAYKIVANKRERVWLSNTIGLKGCRVAGEHRIEVIGDAVRSAWEELKALGCTTEIIAHTQRMFVPLTGESSTIIEKIQAIA